MSNFYSEYRIHLISCNSIVVGRCLLQTEIYEAGGQSWAGPCIFISETSHHHPPPLRSSELLSHLNISGSVFSSLALNPAGYSSLSNGYSGATGYPGYNQPGYGCLGAYPGVPTSFSSMSPYTQDPLSMAGYGMSSLSSGTTIASPDSSLKPDVR